MMTTNLFAIANVKQMRIGGIFPEHFVVLASHIQQFLTVFTFGLSLTRFWGAFGISRGLNTPKHTPSPYATGSNTDKSIVTLLSLLTRILLH